MELTLNELFEKGQKALEAEVTRVLKEHADQEAKDDANDAAYMAAVEATLHEALPECTWRYIDTASVNPRLTRFPNVFLTLPDRAPIWINVHVDTSKDGSFVCNLIDDNSLVVPAVAYQAPNKFENGGVEYVYTTSNGDAKRTNNLSFAAYLALQRRQEFDCLQARYATELVEAERRYQALLVKDAQKAPEPTAKERLHAALVDMVNEVLDCALVARERL